MSQPNPTQVITGKVRFSYMHVFEAHAMEDDQQKKYSVSLIISKKDKVTLAKIETAIKAALEVGKAKLGGKIPPTWKNPLRDGDVDRADDEAYTNSFFVSANSSKRPGLVDVNINPIIDQEELYSGCYGRASVNFYAFNASGNKGVACGLNNLQKLEDGERLAGGTSAEEDFGSLPIDGDDLM